MQNQYTGVKVLDVDPEKVNEVYKNKLIKIWDNRISFYPNMYVYLKPFDGNNGVITVVKDDELHLVHQPSVNAFGVSPKNKEQTMALHTLLDKDIPLNILTGVAGTGKTLLAIAAALEQVQSGLYKRILITRPMSQVGRYDLGSLPGDVNDKFGPYLENYLTNISQIVGENKGTVEYLTKTMNITAMPLQLIRGASWANTFVIADEVQVLDHNEMLTLGTRIGENSKLVILGDLRQRDEKISKQNTGLYKLANDAKAKASPLISAIELIKCERSPLAALVADIFGDD